MRMSFRQTVFATTAIVGLTAMSGIAAPPGATDATTPAPSAGAPMRTSPVQTAPAQAAPGSQGAGASGMSNGAQDNTQADDNAPATRQSMEAQVEQRIEDLHSKLQITAAQEPVWKKFAQTMRDNARKMDQTFEQRIGQMDSMNALDNMKSYARISREHAEDVQALLPPFQALYGKMSQSQKQTADQVFREDANRGAAQAQHG
jgi:protein CpxP